LLAQHVPVSWVFGRFALSLKSFFPRSMHHFTIYMLKKYFLFTVVPILVDGGG
jgi:hypothetical protein